jgi:endogenous inhibitor of DNA gyrase (YacG/DUF329 family)
MKSIKTVFECDRCKVQIERGQASPVFPYPEGWVYLYSLNFQWKSIPDRVERRDLHFCSKTCMLKYLGGLVGD